MDARWTKKRDQNPFGYKNHVAVDVKHKFIRKWQVSAANVHDSQRGHLRLLPGQNGIPVQKCPMLIVTVFPRLFRLLLARHASATLPPDRFQDPPNFSHLPSLTISPTCLTVRLH